MFTILNGSGLIAISKISERVQKEVSLSQTSNDPQAESQYAQGLVYIGNVARHRVLRYTDTSSGGPIVTKMYEGFIANIDETTGPAQSNSFLQFGSLKTCSH